MDEASAFELQLFGGISKLLGYFRSKEVCIFFLFSTWFSAHGHFSVVDIKVSSVGSAGLLYSTCSSHDAKSLL